MARGQGSFGLSSTRGIRGGRSSGAHFRGNYRGRGRGRGGTTWKGNDAMPVREDDGTQLAERFERVKQNDEIDEKLGFARVDQGQRREGWLINMHTVCCLFVSYASWLIGIGCKDTGQRSRLALWEGCSGLLLYSR